MCTRHRQRLHKGGGGDESPGGGRLYARRRRLTSSFLALAKADLPRCQTHTREGGFVRSLRVEGGKSEQTSKARGTGGEEGGVEKELKPENAKKKSKPRVFNISKASRGQRENQC